ncbi:MAG: helix-turn-helix domain-containing protein, partial [Clostridia bacterium]|nr:helix-turn-helix domain-containing protein [Clostridia bacterium]
MIGNKEIMAKNIKRHMDKNHVNATDVCKALNFSNSTFSDWINAKSYPRIDKIEMLANYFGVS